MSLIVRKCLYIGMYIQEFDSVITIGEGDKNLNEVTKQ